MTRLVAAVLAFTDCDAAFGPEDPRTAAAKERMRDAAAAINELQPTPALTVLDGGLADGEHWLDVDAALDCAPPPTERPFLEHER